MNSPSPLMVPVRLRGPQTPGDAGAGALEDVGLGAAVVGLLVVLGGAVVFGVVGLGASVEVGLGAAVEVGLGASVDVGLGAAVDVGLGAALDVGFGAALMGTEDVCAAVEVGLDAAAVDVDESGACGQRFERRMRCLTSGVTGAGDDRRAASPACCTAPERAWCGVVSAAAQAATSMTTRKRAIS